MDVAWDRLSQRQRDAVLDGEGTWHGGKFPGVRAWFAWLETRTYKMHVRVLLSRYREYALCKDCNGARLNPTAMAYHVAGLSLGGWHGLTVADARAKLDAFDAHDPQGLRVKAELASRL